jgi:3',5'-cyclic AMP phosphodiesterase CpdA
MPTWKGAEGITAPCTGLACRTANAEEALISTLAHISDLHGTPVVPGSIRPLLGKRLLGWLSWRVRRSAIHRGEILDALVDDLAITRPDQIAITGDLTNISLETEFPAAREWLRRIGTPERVTAVPGNHDAYVRVPRARSWELWSEYLESDREGRALLGAQSESDGIGLSFPSVRLRAPLAIVGVCSALPTPPFFASGEVGAEQLERLERALFELEDRELFRVVLIHHPPAPHATSARRGLRDAGALCDVLHRVGAELVLHGHLHRTRIDAVEGPRGPIPVVCGRSASDVGLRPGRRAQYHLFEIDARAGDTGRARFRATLRVRGWNPQERRFTDEGDAREIPIGSA